MCQLGVGAVRSAGEDGLLDLGCSVNLHLPQPARDEGGLRRVDEPAASKGGRLSHMGLGQVLAGCQQRGGTCPGNAQPAGNLAGGVALDLLLRR